MSREKISQQSPDFRSELLARLKEAAPDAFSEGRLDVEKLKTLLGEAVETRPERYEFHWAGKRDAIAMLQAPTRATLVPDVANSVDFENAQHVFIEGENLEVLKVLYRSYFGRVKLIYIDPPYNTGNDFVYRDEFADPLDHYLRITGQKNGNGDYLTSQPERNGRFHSSWLSMMYPRLSLARQLLSEDGVMLVSIDDHEVTNLRRLLDDLFGEENFIAQIVWEKGRKNDAKLLSTGHEYVLIYARAFAALKEARTIWREEKPGAREIWNEYVRLREIHLDDDREVERELQSWFGNLPKTHPSKKWSRYKRVDSNGPWRDRDISWPGGDGPRYDVFHPVTRKPCKVPERGWIYSKPEEMQRQIGMGLVVFRDDHTEPPFRKFHIKPIAYEVLDGGDDIFDEEDSDNGNEELATQVRGTVIYKQSQVAVKYLRGLLGAKVFDNPKDHEELARLFRYIASDVERPTILDFFAGSASSAEAVIQLAANGMKHASFLAVQFPEPVNANERSGRAALAAGWKTIVDIARERVRRVLRMEGRSTQGFRAFRLASSNLRNWAGVEEKLSVPYAAQLEAFSDMLVPGWNPENVIWEVALREGFSLTARIEKLAEPPDGTYWRVKDIEQDRAFTICLDERLALDSVRALGLGKNDVFVCRDAALDDTLAANLALQCRFKVI